MSAIKKFKPITPGQRGKLRIKKNKLYKGRPYRTLTKILSPSSGRNHTGKITVRHRGGRAYKKIYRKIDYKRIRDNIPARVERIEYDPNRTAHIALIVYKDGIRSYILALKHLAEGDQVLSGFDAPITVGNCKELQDIPVGTVISSVELKPGKGAQLARTAGASAQLVAKEGALVTIRLPSGEMRKVHKLCRATVGEIGNSAHNLETLGKAGAKRWKGIRPTVRGVAMNPVDHPHGGGEGKTSGGRHPVSPWGKPTKGYKTRTNKITNKYIVRRRKAK